MPATRFIGREAELDSLAALLERGRRLITLVGPPGCGKSRLAAQFLASARRGPVPSVRCGAGQATTVVELCEAVQQALGLAASGSSAVERIGDALAHRGAVLVCIDDADGLEPAAGEVLLAWLAAAREITILVSSRRRLGIEGEQLLELGPLTLDDAIELFGDRAALSCPRFEVDDRNRATIAELVELLDRLPLSIELAGGRVDVLGADGLVRRLEHPLDVLTTTSHAIPARRAGLRHAIEVSWRLLPEAARSVLAQASIFAGSFSLEAAEAVLEAPGTASMLDVLQELRQQSLLGRQESGGHVRFVLSRGVRAFARAALTERDPRSIEARHRAFYLAYSDGWGIGRLAGEKADLLAVLDRALVGGDRDDALRLVLVLDRVLSARGPVDEHLALLNRCLDAPEPALASLIQRAYRARGNALRMRGDLDAALADLNHASDGAAAELAAALLADIGVVHHQRRDIDQARTHYQVALTAARRAHCRLTEARALGNLAALAHDVGQYDDAVAQYRQAITIFAELHDVRHEGIFLTNLAIAEQERGTVDDARTHFRAALELLQAVPDRRLAGITLGNLAALEHAAGNLEVARSSYEQSLAWLEEIGELRSEALCRCRLAAVLAPLDELVLARDHIDRAERLLERVDDFLGFRTVQLARTFLSLSEYNRARLAGDERAAELRWQEIANDIAAARAGNPSLVDRSDDARALIRILESALAQQERSGLAPDALLVGPEARWFRAPAGAWQDVRSRRPLRLLMLCLTERLRAQPGRGVSVDELVDAGWPDEKVQRDAGSNRVYVALNKLRKMGLDGILLRDDSGYYLDPQIPLRRIVSDWRLLGETPVDE